MTEKVTTVPMVEGLVRSDHEVTVNSHERATDQSEYIHRDLVRVVEPWAVENHISPPSGVEMFGSPEAWAKFVARYGDENSLIRWNEDGLYAALDYHVSLDEPRRNHWRAQYEWAFSPEWREWTYIAGNQPHSQSRVCEFLDDHLADVSHPEATTLLETLRTLRSHVSSTAKTTLNADGTSTVSFTKSGTVKSGTEEADLPNGLKVRIPVLAHPGATVYELEIKLRVAQDYESLAFRFTMPLRERAKLTALGEQVAAAQDYLADGMEIMPG